MNYKCLAYAESIIKGAEKTSALIVLLLLFLSPDTIFASNISDKVYQIDQVEVKAQRPVHELALTHTVIDSTGVEESMNATLSELLTKHTTIFVKTFGMGSNATVSFRGTGASHTNVKWNGIAINNPMLGQFDFSQIPVNFVDKIELYHGASSMQSGSGALGGTVSVSSKPKWDDKFYGELTQGVGSYGHYQSFVSVGGGSQKVQVKVRYLYERAKNNFKFKNINQVGHPWMRQRDANYDKHVATADLYWNMGRGNVLSFNSWVGVGERKQPPLMSVSSQSRRVEKLENDDLRFALSWKKYGTNYRSKLISGFQYLKLEYTDNNLGIGYMLMHTESVANSVLNNYTFEYDFSNRTMLKLIANVDYHYTKVRDIKKSTTNRPDRVEAGLGISLHHMFSDSWGGFVLLRSELIKDEFQPIMPSIGVEYNPLKNNELVFKVNAARNYHAPTLNDLYWIPGGNEDLKSERGYSLDLSVSYSKQVDRMKFDFSVAGYGSWIKDWILWEPYQSSTYWTARNSKQVFSRGVELYASANYIIGKFSTTLSGNYSYTRSTNEKVYSGSEKSIGKQLVYVPLHKGNMMLEAYYGDWYLWWVWSLVSKRYTTPSNETGPTKVRPSYDIQDVTVGRKVSVGKVKLDIQAKAYNIFGRVYHPLPSRPMPRQNFAFIVKATF